MRLCGDLLVFLNWKNNLVELTCDIRLRRFSWILYGNTQKRTRALFPLPLNFLGHHCRSFTCFQRDGDSVFMRHSGLFSCCKRDTAEWLGQLTRRPSDV